MLFFGKSMHDINEGDLLGLIDDKVEGDVVDFKKSAYPPLSDAELQKKAQAKETKKEIGGKSTFAPT